MDKTLCLQVQNKKTKRDKLIVYPCDKYEFLRAVSECQLEYGSGDYIHFVNHRMKEDDSFYRTMAYVIENPSSPPSFQELNYFSKQIQKMPDAGLRELEQKLKNTPNATITEAINITHSLLSDNIIYDGVSMSERRVVLENNEAYIRARLVSDLEQAQEGIWIDLPARKDDFETAAQELGLGNAKDLIISEIQTCSNEIFESFYEDNPFSDRSIGTINALAKAMKENITPQELAKFDAAMQMEVCLDDYEKASEIAKNLDNYVFFTEKELFDRYKDTHDDLDYGKLEEIASEFWLENTCYGYVTDGTVPVFEYEQDLNL